MPEIEKIWRDIVEIREKSPMIYNISDSYVMNNTANSLMALGARSVMALETGEVEEIIQQAGSLVVNIRTTTSYLVDAMSTAMNAAKANGVPIVFDPVRAGTTKSRTELAQKLIGDAPPTIIRGNETEIPAILSTEGRAKLGARDENDILDPLESAKALALETGAVVVVSGPIDYITDGKSVRMVKNGSPMMVRVIGMGCTATAICGAFLAVNSNPMDAATNAMATMGVTGEIAASIAQGPGWFQAEFLDTLYRIDRDALEKILKP